MTDAERAACLRTVWDRGGPTTKRRWNAKLKEELDPARRRQRVPWMGRAPSLLRRHTAPSVHASAAAAATQPAESLNVGTRLMEFERCGNASAADETMAASAATATLEAFAVTASAPAGSMLDAAPATLLQLRATASSVYNGVEFDEHKHRWRASVTIMPGNFVALGYFDSEIAAARAYDAALRFPYRLTRVYALNFPAALPPARTASAAMVTAPAESYAAPVEALAPSPLPPPPAASASAAAATPVYYESRIIPLHNSS